jgi:hypothetical protein
MVLLQAFIFGGHDSGLGEMAIESPLQTEHTVVLAIYTDFLIGSTQALSNLDTLICGKLY